MKIQCDVCNKDEASVFCTADEAALCDVCDHRVHHANKLASKHHRFSLLHPSSKNPPLCDICKEKRAFLFCQQDRAILCRDCDVPIHTANEHTLNHNRYLLTGVKLSATSAVYISSSSSCSSVTNSGDIVSDSKSHQQPSIKKVPLSVTPVNSNTNPPSIATTLSSNPTVNKGGDNMVTSEGICSTSSISEYLMEMLPGWHVEDFLDSPSTPYGFCKTDDCILPFVDGDLESNMSSFSAESLGLWVPQAPSSLYPSQQYLKMGGQNGSKETKDATHMKANRRWTDDIFTVPQISPPSTTGFKRSRPFW